IASGRRDVDEKVASRPFLAVEQHAAERLHERAGDVIRLPAQLDRVEPQAADLVVRGVPRRLPVVVEQLVVVEVQVLAAAAEGDVKLGQLDQETPAGQDLLRPGEDGQVVVALKAVTALALPVAVAAPPEAQLPQVDVPLPHTSTSFLGCLRMATI